MCRVFSRVRRASTLGAWLHITERPRPLSRVRIMPYEVEVKMYALRGHKFPSSRCTEVETGWRSYPTAACTRRRHARTPAPTWQHGCPVRPLPPGLLHGGNKSLPPRWQPWRIGPITDRKPTVAEGERGYTHSPRGKVSYKAAYSARAEGLCG